MEAKSKVRLHSDDERQPCGSCRLKLILAGVEPARIDQIKSFDETQALLKKAVEISAHDPNVWSSVKSMSRVDKLCRGIHKHFEPKWKDGSKSGLMRSEYELAAKCNTCGVWIEKAKVKAAVDAEDPMLEGYDPFGEPGRIHCPCCRQRLKQKTYTNSTSVSRGR